MQITFTIPDKDIKDALMNRLECDIYDHYFEDVIKDAKLPSKSKVVKQLMADAKFMAGLAKRLPDYIDIDVYDAVAYFDCPLIDQMETQAHESFKKQERAIEAAQAEFRQQAEEASDAKAIARTIKALEKAGYKITKA